MKNSLIFFSLIAISLLLPSCMYYYQPTLACAPSFTKKHEIYLEGNAAYKEFGNNQVSAGISVTDKVAVTSAYSYSTASFFIFRPAYYYMPMVKLTIFNRVWSRKKLE